MSQLTNLEEFTLRIFLEQLRCNPSCRSFEPLILSSANCATRLLEEIGSVPLVQTNEEPEIEVPRDDDNPEPSPEPTPLSEVEL